MTNEIPGRDRRVPAGHVATYVSPYGVIAGLAPRLGAWSAKMRARGSPFPFAAGLIADLELAMQLLNLREFAQYLEVHGTDEQRRWAGEIHGALDEVEQAETLYTDIEQVLPVAVGQEYSEAVEVAAKKAVQYDAVRAVLEQVGAITADDTGTDLPALIRALLS